MATAARVWVRYDKAPNLPLWVSDAVHGEFVRSLSVARATGGTVFHVSPYEWETIIKIANYVLIGQDEVEVIDHLRRSGRAKSGQGFGLTSKERSPVEMHAMGLATKHFEKDWPSVEDVSLKASYDLHCRRGNEELRVEVKGTTTTGERIILTSNEVEQARKEGYALFVVTEIELDRSRPDEPQAAGGKCTLFMPAVIEEARLEPIAYSYVVEWGKGVLLDYP